MKFGMFVMADFLETVVIAGMTTALFLGGWQVPYLQASGFVFPWGGDGGAAAPGGGRLQVRAFLTKVVVMIWFLMLIRWTLPRFRYDQAMRLGWLGLFPLSILNIVRHRPGAAGGGEALSHGLPDDQHPRRSRGTRAGSPPPALLPGRGAGAGWR